MVQYGHIPLIALTGESSLNWITGLLETVFHQYFEITNTWGFYRHVKLRMRFPYPRVEKPRIKMYASLMRQSLLNMLPMDVLGGCGCKGACQTTRCGCKAKGKYCGPRCSCYRRRAGSKQCVNRDTTRSGTKCDCKTACMSWRCPCKKEDKECDSGCNCGTRKKRCKNRVSDAIASYQLHRSCYNVFCPQSYSMLEEDDSKPVFMLVSLQSRTRQCCTH